MRKILAIALATLPMLTAPVLSQTYSEQRRWDAAQARYRSETQIYQRERDAYIRAQSRGRGGYDRGGEYDQGGGYDQGGVYRQDGGYQQSGAYQSGTYPQGGYRQDGYENSAPQGGYRDTYATDYDAARYYRDGPTYRERRLTAEDQVYRGSDGRYYCKRSDGTTGLIIGGVGGALIGSAVDGTRNGVAGTLIGGALGALAGRAIDQNSDVRCR